MTYKTWTCEKVPSHTFVTRQQDHGLVPTHLNCAQCGNRNPSMMTVTGEAANDPPEGTRVGTWRRPKLDELKDMPPFMKEAVAKGFLTLYI